MTFSSKAQRWGVSLGQCALERWFRRFLLLLSWLVLAVAVVFSFGAACSSAWAAGWSEAELLGAPQRPIVPRRMADALLIDFYVGPERSPDLPIDRLRGLAHEEYRRAFGHDLRTEWSGRGPEQLPGLAQAAASESDLLLVRQLEVGRQLYRMGDLHEATRSIEHALQQIADTELRWSRQDLLADSLEILALAYQELSAAPDLRAVEWESQTRLALRELIRLRPDAQVDARRYPLSFVEAWRTAYFEQLVVSAAVLALRIEEARIATRLLDVDVLADLRVMYGPRGASLALRVYDRVADRFAYDGILAWDGSEAHLAEQLSRAFSIARDCMSLTQPIVENERKKLLHSNYLSADALFFVYLDRPTRGAFLNTGFRLGGHHYVTPVVGFYADLSVAFSNRDRAGTLLEPIQMQSLSAGFSLQYERPRFRVFFDVGPEIARRSEIVATRSFWCRVSGGQSIEYDAMRRCTDDEVFRQRPSGLVGVHFKAGLAGRLVGPIWLSLSVYSTAYLVPFGHRGVDRPMGASAGIIYGF